MAGVWLGGRVEGNVVPVLLMIVVMPAFGTAGVLLWDRIPRGLRDRLRPGMEVALIVPLLLLGASAAYALGPAVEAGLFPGDFPPSPKETPRPLDDPRHRLVVWIPIGFSVISPILSTT